MLAPQSDDELRPVIEALRRLDPLLGIRWNSTRYVLRAGSYSALGVRTDPVYDGRWEVIRFETATKLHADRDYTVICTVTEPIEVGGIRCLVDGGAYAPVGLWLVDFLHAADAANVRAFEAIRAKLWAQDDALEHTQDCAEEAMTLAALDRVHFDAAYAGGVGNWQGKGAAFPDAPSPGV